MIGLGCMRLSTAEDRDDARGIAVIHAALDAGATILDTADVYCRDATEIGHNERLIARALSAWGGDRSALTVATKGGLRRRGRAWVTDGRAKHLRMACEASLLALGVDAIDLYQLHAPDPRTPLDTSVRALASLRASGHVRRIGLCNVNVSQIEVARRITEIDCVQVELSPFAVTNVRNGVAEYCRDHGIRMLAYRPLGGDRKHRVARDPVLAGLAEERGVSAYEVALAWLLDLAPNLVPIPGSTRVSSARSSQTADSLELTSDERARLDARFPAGAMMRAPRAQRMPASGTPGDVVLVMGMPGAGKSSVAAEYEARGYERLNRDERGGRLSDLVQYLDAGLAEGRNRWVLDNTYASRAARNEVIECAWRHGTAVRCITLETELPDAQVNAITRLLEAHGRLPTPDELRQHGRHDSRYFGPDAQFRFQREVESPVPAEGFTTIESVPFVRHANVAGTAATDRDMRLTGRALVLEFDAVLADSASGADVVVDASDVMVSADRRTVLADHVARGYRSFTYAWRPQVNHGTLTLDAVTACFERVRELLGIDLEFGVCTHPAGPPVCWCRKPLPGLVLEFAQRHRVQLRGGIVVGKSAADRTLAQRLDMEYRAAEEFFKPEPNDAATER